MNQQLTFRIFALLLVCSLWASAQQIDTTHFRSQLGDALEQTDIKTINFGFVTREGNRFTKSFGPAVLGGEDQLTDDHIFRIASMTKAITSVAVLQLLEQGRVNLDDKVSDILPGIDLIPILSGEEFLQPSISITLRHLLTHTSGFGYNFVDPRLGAFEKPAYWPHSDLPRLAEAGTQWIYGTSTDWVGRIVEQVSGTSLEEYFRSHITGPLGMWHTWFNVPDTLTHMIVSMGRRHEQDNSQIKEVPGRIPSKPVENYSGGGGVFSSLNDYLIFLECILNGGELNGHRILKQETIDLMFVDQLPVVFGTDKPATAGNMGHSLAWAIQTAANDYGRLEGSAYWSGAYNSFYSIDKNTGIAVVVLANLLPFGDKELLELYRNFEAMVRK